MSSSVQMIIWSVYLCRNIPLFDSRGALGFPYGFIPPGTDEYEQAKVQSLCMCMCACVFECECVNVLMHYKLFVGVYGCRRQGSTLSLTYLWVMRAAAPIGTNTPTQTHSPNPAPTPTHAQTT
jgi:hypothetical protein